MNADINGSTIQRILVTLLNYIRRNQTATVPSKISQMELAAYDTVAYDEDCQLSVGGSSINEAMENKILENTLTLGKPAFIAGDAVTGTVNVRSSGQSELLCVNLSLIGEGRVYYHNTNYRKQRLCEIKSPLISLKEHCTESGRAWSIPFSLQSTDDLSSTIDGEKKGEVRYYVSWEIQGNVGSICSQQQDVIILANHSLETLPRSHEITGNNLEEEEHDNMKLQLYSPASAYLPGERIQFRAFVQNGGKKMVKKIAVFLIQNALFYKSRRNNDVKGRTRSFLMSAKEKSAQLKQGEQVVWTDEVQIPDPVAPSADGFHKIDYELVLVVITKGKKSNTKYVFNEVRYHFDMETYQDDHFRDYLPHASCDLQIGSHHGSKLSASMSSGEQPIRAINEIWKRTPNQSPAVKVKSKSQNSNLTTITFDAN